MTSITKLEYRVKKVERYIVTRYAETEEDGLSKRVSERGVFDNPDQAWETAYALCKLEHEQYLGLPLDDERIQYPRHPKEEEASKVA